ncbi:uncharacterized protein [Asterias amurensis]|uniref:uncharacterized protein n=1 Tax=Asterias amurensis TaxID=7602 RepID=UPI003AB4595E
MATLLQVLLVIFVVNCGVLVANCRVYEPNVSLYYGQADAVLVPGNGGILQNKEFGFGTHGSLDGNLECKPTVYKNSENSAPNLWLLGCTALEKKELEEIGHTRLNQACQKLQFPDDVEKNFSIICQAIPVNPIGKSQSGNYWEAHHKFSRNAFLSFMLLQCPREVPNKTRMRIEEVRCKGRLVVMNNNKKSHLSIDEGALLPMYKILVMVWVVLQALWIANWIKFREFSNHLHKLMFVAPSFKFLLLTLSLVWWEIIAATGYENTTLEMYRDIIQSTEVVMLFMTMMLAAEGWCVLRPRIRNIRCLLIPVLFLVFLGSSICAIWVHNYFMAFAVCSIVFVIYRTVKWSTYNMLYLTRQILRNSRYIQEKHLRFNNVSITKQLTEKRNIFIRLRFICTFYTIVFAMVITMSTFLTEYAWAQTIAYELPELMVFIGLGLIFRLRDFAPFENIKVILPKENSVIILLPFPHEMWPKRQKLALGKPINQSSDFTEEDQCDEDKF